jgi:hypothetical protein
MTEEKFLAHKLDSYNITLFYDVLRFLYCYM